MIAKRKYKKKSGMIANETVVHKMTQTLTIFKDIRYTIRNVVAVCLFDNAYSISLWFLVYLFLFLG